MTAAGLIFDIKKYAVHDGPGIRTTVFFHGCPLDCWWCHNPEARGELPEGLPTGKAADSFRWYRPRPAKPEAQLLTIDAVMDEIKRDEVFYNISGGGVTFSGGEPMMQIDFLHDLLTACRENGLHTALDTSGYAPGDDFERSHPFNYYAVRCWPGCHDPSSAPRPQHY